MSSVSKSVRVVKCSWYLCMSFSNMSVRAAVQGEEVHTEFAFRKLNSAVSLLDFSADCVFRPLH